MATFLDVSLFAHFGAIFVMLFVFVVVYGFLMFTKIFKGTPGERGLYAIIALVAAVLAGFSEPIFALIVNMTPWFVGLIIFLFLIFVVIRMFTGDDPELFKGLIQKSPIYWLLVVFFVIILIIGLSSTFGQDLLEDRVPDNATLTSAPTSTTGSAQQITVVQAGTTTSSSVTTTTSETATDDFGTNVTKTMTHPKVLGLMLMFIIGVFTVLFIANSSD